MNRNDIIALGLGLESPWKIVEQVLVAGKIPHELRLTVKADRGSVFPYPECGQLCKAHDFKEMTWRHLNFFQHHCYITAPVPRVRCPQHGVKRIQVPWARKGAASLPCCASKQPCCSSGKCPSCQRPGSWR